jgi:chromosome segregation ATPase
MLLEVQEELEAARWSMAEELASRQREVETSREEARRAWQQREEALETQRRELTAAFEKLMKQSDDSYLEREAKIASQIVSLEQRIESVQNTNASLRSELVSATRARDLASGELERKEETIRQLNWRFEDALGSWKRAEDALERRVAQAIAEADSSRDSMIRQIHDAHHELEKVRLGRLIREYGMVVHSSLPQNRLEIARERDLRAVVEEKCKALRREMADERAHLEAARREALTERSLAETAHAAEISALQQKLFDLQSEIDLHKTAIEATHVTQVEELEGRYLRQIKDLEKRYVDCAAERDHLQQSSRTLRSELEEQRTEAGALRLRLELQDARLTQLQQQLQQHQQQVSSMSNNDFAKSQTPLASNFRDGNALEVSVDSVHSPMFSDDFGPASLPLSPGGFGLIASPQRPAATRPAGQRDGGGGAASINALHELSVRDQEISRLREENRTLRDAIHEVSS